MKLRIHIESAGADFVNRLLSKSDFDVFSKLGQHCLERGFITEAFAWSEIGGEDDVPQPGHRFPG